MKIYQVGGAVRDQMLGRDMHDVDYVVVGARPELMLQRGYRPVGKHFPVFLHPDTSEEYALARTERSVGERHADFVFNASPSVTLEEDLLRRDLTINAMARDVDGTLIDPHDGEGDVQSRVLRHIGPHFIEDPLRVLRVARLAAELAQWGFVVASETRCLISQMVRQGALNALTPERIWKETLRALASSSPRRYIEVLRECGALKAVLPEVDRLFGVPQPALHHPEVDTGEHVLLALERATELSDDPAVRFATLMHDLGKGLTPPTQWPRHIGHEESGVPLVDNVCRRLRVPVEYHALAAMASRHHLRIHRALEMRPKKILKLFRDVDALRKPDRFAALLLACEADARGRQGFEQNAYPQRHFLTGILALVRSIRARDVAPDAHGPAVGEAVYRAQLHAVARFMEARPTAGVSLASTETPDP